MKMNTQTSRRAFVATLGIAPLAAGCSSLSQLPTVTAQVVSDINTIANGVSAVLPTISAITGVGSGVGNAVSAVVSDARNAANAVSTALTTVAAQPFVSTVAGDLKAAVAALSGISLPSNVSSVLTAAQSLIPVVQAAVGLFSSIPLAGGMSPDQARTVLRTAGR